MLGRSILLAAAERMRLPRLSGSRAGLGAVAGWGRAGGHPTLDASSCDVRPPVALATIGCRLGLPDGSSVYPQRFVLLRLATASYALGEFRR
nr:unnamed protein product [Digitaria exilis]